MARERRRRARTLYYHVSDERALWSTDLAALLEISGVPIEVNKEYVARFRTSGPEAGLTPYVGIHAVKPAHIVRIDADGVVTEQRFCPFDPYREIHYSMDAEYQEHFRATSWEAERARLRSDGRVSTERSGYSFWIVCLARTKAEIEKALGRHKGDVARTAKALGIDRTTLSWFVDKYHLPRRS